MVEKLLNSELDKKLMVLKEIINQYKKPCIAFSGGVDSTLLLQVTVDVVGNAVVPITVNGSMMPRSEFEDAKELSESFGARLEIINFDVFAQTEFVENDPERCYYCKKNIFTQIKKRAETLGCDVIFDGSNLDDQSDDRPGLKALCEMEILSPLTMAKLTKQEIRELSKKRGLSTAEKPSMACLATRIPSGEKITPKKLRMIETGEECLKELGLQQYRLRSINGTAKIECLPSDFEIILENSDVLVKTLKAIGFKGVSLDLAGYQSGSMNGVKK
ncbi:MAG: ATP-dependent sacrificial sulfur transferase LarE [Eubacterium sp.]